MAILIVGIILYFIKLFRSENREILKNGNNKLKLAVFIIGLAVFIMTFIKISILFSLIIIAISLLALYKIFDKTKMDDLPLDFIMLFWFVANFSFFTYYHIKVDRYFMPMLPVVAYFIIVSLELIFDKLKSVKYMDKIKVIAPIGLVCLILLCSAVYALGNAPHTFDNQMHPNFATAASEEKAVCEWLIQHDPQYANKTIWADRGGDMSFLLKKEIPSLEKRLNETNLTDDMLKNNVTYFIAQDNRTIGEPYTKLYQNGEVNLYYYKNGH